jgi:hypothetical protein
MIYMNVSIKIDYIVSSRASRSGSFPLRGRKPEKVALEWWKQIKKEMGYRAVLDKVLADMEDITQLVKDLEKKELNNALNDDLPF